MISARALAIAVITLALGADDNRAQSPTAWPLGCLIPSTLENNGTTPLLYIPGTPTVTGSLGQIVKFGNSVGVELPLPPGETVTSYWDQTDGLGQPVPPGIYYVNGRPFDVGATNIALATLGSPHVGARRSIELCAPGQPNAPYVLAASFSSSVGLPLGCGRQFPLDGDALLVASLTNQSIFPDFLGALGADGRTSQPAIVLPATATLVGIPFDLAFVTADPLAACGIGLISAAVHTIVQ